MKLPEWAKWLARDRDGELYAFEIKPVKSAEDGEWFEFECGRLKEVGETDDTFSHVKWEDEYPTTVDKDRNTFKWLEKPDLLPTEKTFNEVFGTKPDEKPTEVKTTTLPEWANWLARDGNGKLYTYSVKPLKTDGYWDLKNLGDIWVEVDETDDTFSHIKWEDEEPTEIKRGPEAAGISAEELNRIMNAKAHGYDEVPEVTDKDGDEITSISFEEAMALVENKVEVIQYDWLAENRMENEVDETPDIINEPNHYKGKHGTETIDVIRAFGNDDMIAGFYWGNAIEYMIHYRNKNGLEDLKKARKNLDWLIEHMEGF